MKFKNKIKYIVLDSPPEGIMEVSEKDSDHIKNSKYILEKTKDFLLENNFLKFLAQVINRYSEPILSSAIAGNI